MDGVIEENIIADSIDHEDNKFDEKPPEVRIPRSGYILCHLAFFFLGVCHFLPTAFFAAANNFWMYKFRNISDTSGSAENRTFLQKNYASANMIVGALLSLIFGILNVTHAHRFKIVSRVVTTLSMQITVFILFTISVKTRTEHFQVAFFALVLLGVATLTGASTVNIVSTMNLYPRFPSEFMKTCFVGEGCAGIVGDILNILSVYIFSDDITDATLMYFIFGTCVVSLTLALILIISRAEFFQQCIASVPQKVEKKMPSKHELMNAIHKIRLVLLITFFLIVGYSAAHTSVTALVVSEQDIRTSSWAKNYFSPVMTFLLGNVGLLTGRLISSYVPFKISGPFTLILSILRLITLVPFIWFCNAQPRDHLPVLFPHDYQYGIILGLFMIISGYLINVAMLFIPQKVELHEADVAYTLFGLAVNVMETLTSPIGLFIVNIL